MEHHALNTATTLLAQELAPKLRVVGIAPGITLVSGEQTEQDFQIAHKNTPLGRSSTPEDIASAVDIMVENKISTLPVIEGKELVGVLTEYDVIELLSACRERDMLFVQISGLDDNEKEATDVIYADIEDMVKKISKVYKPESLTMHVSRYNDAGGNFKYSISARLFINGTAVMGKEVGWDLTKTASDLIKKLEDAVMNMKDSKVTFRKRKK